MPPAHTPWMVQGVRPARCAHYTVFAIKTHKSHNSIIGEMALESLGNVRHKFTRREQIPQ
jgi:hypothetical protein